MFTSLSRRRVLALVVLTCVLLITLDSRGSAVIDRLREVFARVVQPFDTATRAVAMPLARAWNGVVNYSDVLHENEVLRDQIEHMKGTDIEARSAVLEYRELLKLNQLTSKFQFDTVEAQVVGESPSNFQNTIEINVGSRQGVAAGMPVTDGAGLIGRITKVFPSRSIVLLITDPSFAISAQVLSTSDQIEEQQRPTDSTLLTGQAVSDLTSSTTSTTTTVVLPPGLEPITTTPQGWLGQHHGHRNHHGHHHARGHHHHAGGGDPRDRVARRSGCRPAVGAQLRRHLVGAHQREDRCRGRHCRRQQRPRPARHPHRRHHQHHPAHG